MLVYCWAREAVTNRNSHSKGDKEAVNNRSSSAGGAREVNNEKKSVIVVYNMISSAEWVRRGCGALHH